MIKTEKLSQLKLVFCELVFELISILENCVINVSKLTMIPDAIIETIVEKIWEIFNIVSVRRKNFSILTIKYSFF
jgi:hypothetical protein